jgi:hypothetical protein
LMMTPRACYGFFQSVCGAYDQRVLWHVGYDHGTIKEYILVCDYMAGDTRHMLIGAQRPVVDDRMMLMTSSASSGLYVRVMWIIACAYIAVYIAHAPFL